MTNGMMMQWRPTSTSGSNAVAKTHSAMPCSAHQSSLASRIGLEASRILSNRTDRVHAFTENSGSSRQPVGYGGRLRQETWWMRRHHQLLLHGCGKCTQRGEGQGERKREGCHDQPESSSDRLRWLEEDKERTTLVRGATASSKTSTPRQGPIIRCRRWDLSGTQCTLIKTHLNRADNRAANPGRSRSTNHTRGGGWETGSGGLLLFIVAVLQREVSLGRLTSAFMHGDEDFADLPKGKHYASPLPGAFLLPMGHGLRKAH